MAVTTTRRRIAVAAALASSLAVAACSSAGSVSSNPPAKGDPAAATVTPGAAKSPAAPAPAAGSPLISDGTATVLVGGQPVTFPTTVTDASFAANGSRIVYVNGDGNIETAHVDGSSRVTLTKADPAVKRSHPAFSPNGIVVYYTEKGADGIARLHSVGGYNPTGEVVDLTRGPDRTESTGNSDPATDGGMGTVYQHQGAKGPEVWIIDTGERDGDSWHKLTDGSQPTLSPDSSTVAFVGPDGEIHIAPTGFQVPGKPAVKPARISAGAKSATHLKWSSDGQSVAFSTDHDIESVTVGSAPATPKQLSGKPGTVAFLPAAQAHIGQVAGADPIAEAVAASQARWITQDGPTASPAGGGFWPSATGAVLASPDSPASLTVGAVKSVYGFSPLLLTGKDALDPRTAAELTRILGRPATGDRNQVDPITGEYQLDMVYIAGGPDAVSPAVEAAVTKLGYHVKRLTGADVYAQAIAAQNLKPFTPDATPIVTVASADDLSEVGKLVGSGGYGSVLLTDGAKIPAADLPILDSLTAKANVRTIGAKAAAALASWTGKPAGLKVGVAAPDPHSGFGSRVVVVPTGAPQDALLGGVLADQWSAQLFVEDPAAGLGPVVTQGLDTGSAAITWVYTVDAGGKLTALDDKISALIGGPLGAAVVPNPTA